MLETLLKAAHGKAGIADAAYDSKAARASIKTVGLHPVIPPNPTRKNPHRYNKRLYRKRFRIEVFFHTIKRYRRIATRYEKTERNYLALLHVACAMAWLN
jgi:transposase